MIKHTVTIVFVLFISSCVTEQKREIVDLDHLFTKVGEISLKTEEYLSVRFMEVNEMGELLVTGRRDKVILFSGSGEKIQDLGENAREEHPGLNWGPN